MGASDVFEEYSLEGLFNDYGNTHAELQLVPRGSPRHAELSVRRDELWNQYLAAGGQRIAWHLPVDDPRQEQGRTADGVKLPIRMFEHSLFVHVVRFWIGQSPNQSDQWSSQDSHTLRVWQHNNHIPVTGTIDRLSWSTLVELGGEGGSASPAKVREIATRFRGSKVRASPTILVLEKKQHWMLALDDVPHLTFANQWNLALMATLSYAGPRHVENQLKLLGELEYRDNVCLVMELAPGIKEESDIAQRHRRTLPITYTAKHRVRPFVRPASRGYEVRCFDIPETHTQFFVAWNDVHVIVAARGTETTGAGLKADLYTDVQANGDQWPYGGGTVHHGFFEAFDSLRERLNETLDRALPNGAIKSVFVCGHSLGGALATLIACYLRRARKTLPVQLYTYGQPRVATKSFANSYWHKDEKFSYFRTANALDLVTWVPAIYVCQDAQQFGELAKLALRFWSANKLSSNQNLWLTEAEYLAILKEARAQSATVDKFLAETCSQSHDYRHFGVRVMCGADPEFGSFLLELRQAPDARQVEDELTSRAHRLYDWGALDLAYHAINHTMFDGYLPHLASFFERNARGYLTAGTPRAPLATPALPAAEARLVQRMLQLNRSNWAPPETGYEVVRRMIEESLGSP